MGPNASLCCTLVCVCINSAMIFNCYIDACNDDDDHNINQSINQSFSGYNGVITLEVMLSANVFVQI